MPRRISDYPDMYWFWNYVSSIGSWITVGGVIVFFIMLYELFLNPISIKGIEKYKNIEKDLILREYKENNI